MVNREPPEKKLPKAPPVARLWVRYMLGLGVSVLVGLAPYLGRVKVPLFAPLSALIPLWEQDSLIPLTTAAMGVVAAAIQWYGGERVSRRWLSRWFAGTLILVILAFVLLAYVHNSVVVAVPYQGTQSASFLVGFTRPFKTPCPEDVSDSECIRDHLT